MSQLSSSPYNRGTLVAAAASTHVSTAGEESNNKLVFYSIQEKQAATMLDISPTRHDEAAAGEDPESAEKDDEAAENTI